MTAWLMSIVGVVALGVLLEILLEDSELSKYIKGIFAIAVVLVLVAPLPAFFSKDWSIGDLFSSYYVADNSFVQDIEGGRRQSQRQRLTDELTDKGVKVESLDIFYKNDGSISFVRVAISGDERVAMAVIVEYLGINKEIVRIYSG